MHVYRTAQFDRQVKEHNLESINRFCDELSVQSLKGVQARFEVLGPYLKRKTNGNFRFIGRIVTLPGESAVEGLSILVCLDLFHRSNKKYEDLYTDPKKFGPKYLDHLVKPGDLEDWLLTQQKTNEELRPRPRLTDHLDLLPWLDPPGWKRANEGVMIYESEIWSAQLNGAQMRSHASEYTQLVTDLLSSTQATEAETSWPGIWLYGNGDRYILFSRLVAPDRPSSILFLLYPFSDYPTAEEITEIGDRTGLYNHQENSLQSPIDLNRITALARRAYPNYLLAYDDWLIRESSPKANLPLSAEEEALLHSVSTPGNRAIPLFLNGQAGSGKSTLLFHLFADYCYRKYYNYTGKILRGNPLFLTYNERLLEVAKERVQKILKFHHHFVSQFSPDADLPIVRHFFRPFQSFLLNHLPMQESENFGLDKYISFHQFKVLYQQDCTLSISKSYSPERCWHVIRTFIKGYGIEEMTLEDYEKKVPQKERTVPVAEFEAIYDIWQNWYHKKAEEEGYWDDQDLIKKVLISRPYLGEYTAIFCDESQDFTRIELQLILRLSVFSRYDLGYQPLESLPFVFAGDPFQTLNPTGFRWENFKAAFYNEVINKLDPNRQLGVNMNFQELECNYRSDAPIVKFNNLIQFWRYVLFKHRELKPQRVWKQGEWLPEKFILEDNLPRKTFKEYIRNTIIIIPCEEGEEGLYLQNDEVLSQVVEGWNESEPPKNVLSAIAAKGLEFKRVILYKFGEACDRNFQTFLDSERTELNIETEYFFNKLYVASSRAIERLFVVDTPLGNDRLWSHMNDPHQVEAVLPKLKDSQSWQKRLQYLQTGTNESAKNLEEDDPKSIAEAFRREGLNAKNPELLRRAKQFYQTIGDLEEAHWCEARALQFKGEYETAGLEFLQLGEEKVAWECFWQGSCWLQLYQWYEAVADRPDLRDRHSLEYPLIQFMVTSEETEGTTASLEALQTLTQALQVYQSTQDLSQHCFSSQWKTVLKTYRQQIEGITDEKRFEPSLWYTMGQVLQNLSEAGYSGMLVCAGLCFYRGQSYQRAVDCLTAAKTTGTREYYLAQAQVVGLPKGLEYLKLAASMGELPHGNRDRDDLIYNAWKEAGSVQTAEWLTYVAPILEARQDYEHAFTAYLYLEQPESLATCFEQISDRSRSRQLLSLWLKSLIRQQRWTEIPQIFAKYKDEYLTHSSDKIQVLATAIYELAHSQLHPDRLEIGDRQQYEYLIEQEFLSQSDWENYLFMEQVGIALEKVGGLGVTLKFYQSFCEGHYSSTTKEFARTRWLATKKKQEDYYTTKGKTKRLFNIRSELSQKSRHWKISLDSISANPPAPPKTRPSPPQLQQRNQLPSLQSSDRILQPIKPSADRNASIKVPSTTSTGSVDIQGLPPEVTVKTISFGVQWFSLKHLVIKINATAKQVLIADALSGDRLRIDLRTSTVQFKTFSLTGSKSEPLKFSCFDSRYQGHLQPGDRPQLNIAIEEDEIILLFD